MSLKEWRDGRLIRAEPTSRDEIGNLLALLERCKKDAAVEQISDDLRFAAAYTALLTAATIALRAEGYRVPAQSGYHLRTIDSLAETIGADDKLIRRLKAFSNKRGKATYDAAGSVSQEELRSILRTADELGKTVMEWLKREHPEFV